ncbi:MAG: peptidoglycan-binding protein LysM [Bacteroidia bacterium]|nr:peptidoglycan-binding protein LysM [Bacteroidia bacterium]
MGLFSFLKTAGLGALKKSAKKNEDKMKTAEVARERQEGLMEGILQGAGLNVENIDVEISDDVVTIYGEAASQADREKAILILGNLEGVATIDDRISVVEPEPEAQMYEVKSGDSLSKIAKAYYGDPMKYKEIFEANQPMLKDPNLIYPGQMLRIPAL